MLCDYGYSQYLQCEWNSAEYHLRQAVTVQPNGKRAHNNLGLLLAQTGRREQAVEEFKKAGCTIPQAHMNVGFVLTLNDQTAEAQQEYGLALSADPSSSEARSRLHALDELMAIHTPLPKSATVEPARPEATDGTIVFCSLQSSAITAPTRHSDASKPQLLTPDGDRRAAEAASYDLVRPAHP